MRQLDWVTPQQLAANEHLREIDTHLPATIANERPSGEVLSQTSAIADVAVQRAEELRSSAAASNEMTAQQTIDFNGRFGQVVRTHYTIAAQLNQAVQGLLKGREQNCAAAATTTAQYLARRKPS